MKERNLNGGGGTRSQYVAQADPELAILLLGLLNPGLQASATISGRKKSIQLLTMCQIGAVFSRLPTPPCLLLFTRKEQARS